MEKEIFDDIIKALSPISKFEFVTSEEDIEKCRNLTWDGEWVYTAIMLDLEHYHFKTTLPHKLIFWIYIALHKNKNKFEYGKTETM